MWFKVVRMKTCKNKNWFGSVVLLTVFLCEDGLAVKGRDTLCQARVHVVTSTAANCVTVQRAILQVCQQVFHFGSQATQSD